MDTEIATEKPDSNVYVDHCTTLMGNMGANIAKINQSNVFNNSIRRRLLNYENIDITKIKEKQHRPVSAVSRKSNPK